MSVKCRPAEREVRLIEQRRVEPSGILKRFGVAYIEEEREFHRRVCSSSRGHPLLSPCRNRNHRRSASEMSVDMRIRSPGLISDAVEHPTRASVAGNVRAAWLRA